jgi:hypothetical protein
MNGERRLVGRDRHGLGRYPAGILPQRQMFDARPFPLSPSNDRAPSSRIQVWKSFSETRASISAHAPAQSRSASLVPFTDVTSTVSGSGRLLPAGTQELVCRRTFATSVGQRGSKYRLSHRTRLRHESVSAPFFPGALARCFVRIACGGEVCTRPQRAPQQKITCA